jgi:probable phosphoglycerate mutase
MGWSDEDLDDVGHSQAQLLSSRLANLPIASIYSSPLQRTRTTTAIVAKPHRLDVEFSDDLIELQLGDWQGLHMDEIRQRWPELWRQSRIDPSDVSMPNGESFQQVTERAIRIFKKVLAANQGKQVIMVTHDIVVRVLVAHVLGTSNSIYRRFEINNASLTVVRVINGKALLTTLNDVSHFAAQP